MRERAKDEIRHQIDVFFRAHVNKDWVAIHTQHGEEWRGFSVDARSLLRGSDAHVTQAEAMLKNIELIDYEMIEIDYVFHGTICVVPYIARLRSTRTAGRIVEIKVRVLDVYAQEDGDWHQVASHMSLHPDTLVAWDATVALPQGSDDV
jgi:ketosteroid isomerase-like protein